MKAQRNTTWQKHNTILDVSDHVAYRHSTTQLKNETGVNLKLEFLYEDEPNTTGVRRLTIALFKDEETKVY